MNGYNLGYNLLKGIFTGFNAQAKKVFSRYFNKEVIWANLQGLDYILDTFNSQTYTAKPTIVWKADGTAVLEITESDYPTLDFDKAVVSYVTTGNIGKLAEGTRSAGIYTVNFPVGNVSNVKLIDSDNIPAEVEEIGRAHV